MKIGKRDLMTFLTRICEWESYLAFIRMFSVYDTPIKVCYHEVFSKRTYPTRVRIHTPTGDRIVFLFHLEDLSTLNLIFCRQDYWVPETLKVVVDIGGNIGLSALFWLTHNAWSRVYVYEPVPVNLERIRLNIEGLEERCVIEGVAVSDFRGQVAFGLEGTGKFGGIGVNTGTAIQVDCVHVMDIIQPVLERHGVIDCLKIDAEGQEICILKAIDSKCWKCIRCVNVESFEGSAYLPSYFSSSKRGSAMRFRNTLLC